MRQPTAKRSMVEGVQQRIRGRAPHGPTLQSRVAQMNSARNVLSAGPTSLRFTMLNLAFQITPIFLVLWAEALAADDSKTIPFQPGLYEITTDLKMPNVALNLKPFKTRVCLSSNVVTTGNGLGVQSPNPLRLCPRFVVARTPSRLAFDIRCPGPNAPNASVKYSWANGGFTGVIMIDMGGKSMRLSELQKATRIGPCLDYGQVEKRF